MTLVEMWGYIRGLIASYSSRLAMRYMSTLVGDILHFPADVLVKY